MMQYDSSMETIVSKWLHSRNETRAKLFLSFTAVSFFSDIQF